MARAQLELKLVRKVRDNIFFSKYTSSKRQYKNKISLLQTIEDGHLKNRNTDKAEVFNSHICLQHR